MRIAKKLKLIKGGGELQSKYRILFEQASDAIITFNPNGRIDTLNHAAEELTGYMREQLEGEPISLLIPDSKKTHIPARVRALSQELLTTPGTFEDVAILKQDGFTRLVDFSVRPVTTRKGHLSIALLRDVTEKKQMERELITKHSEIKNAYFELEKKNAELQSMQEMLVQAGKMTALGELATGIAHELNQPLQGIRGYAQELSAILSGEVNIEVEKQKSESALALREIISNVDKMAQIIDYLRTFVRQSTEKHEFTNIHDRIEEALKMLSRQFSARGIKVERNFDPELPLVYANPIQIEQVLINLATNARDAIESTGRGNGLIRVGTRKAAKNFIEITFEDNGIGMDSRTKTKAFNPFFTTKEVGKGMGLGLSLSYGMISKLQGSILVESEVGKGTRFLIRVPQDYRELVE